MHWYVVFGKFFYTTFVNNVHELTHDENKRWYFFFAYFEKNKNNIAYFKYKNATNLCCMVYFVTIHFISVQKYSKVITVILSYL